MNRLIAKQLKSYPKLDKALRISYFEKNIGKWCPQTYSESRIQIQFSKSRNQKFNQIVGVKDLARKLASILHGNHIFR